MLEVHRGLLQDEGRTNAFREAIRRVVTPDSVVLDLGTGSGILALFAAEAGARRVFAIDSTHSADLASFLTRHLGFADRVQVFHEHSKNVALPERADILITETLGSFGFNEHILSSVIDARARLLTPDAVIIPRRVDLYLVPVDDASIYEQRVSWWNGTPYGFDLSPLAVFASNILFVGSVDNASFLASPENVIAAELTTIASADVSGSAHFTAARAGLMHGFTGWFRATLADGIELSNEIAGSNWEQVFLPLHSPIPVDAGTAIDVALESNDGMMWRWKGTIGDIAFDQMTALSSPPCYGVPL
jgi:PRMT5 arginine-N-methyltransferase/ribosomal protein L11 methyltransferase PrmA